MADVNERERGAATVWALALVGLLSVTALVGAAAGELAITRLRVATVADLAALAGAQASSACAEAARIAGANGVTLEACAIDAAGDVRVRVRTGPPVLVQRLATLSGGTPSDVVAEARAGRPP